MKVSIKEAPEGTDPHVVIHCHTIDETVDNLLHYLEETPSRLIGEMDEDTFLLKPEKIFYIESFDRKVFIHGKENVFMSRKKLYELEAELGHHQFFRASKWMILNPAEILSVRPFLTAGWKLSCRIRRKSVFRENMSRILNHYWE